MKIEITYVTKKREKTGIERTERETIEIEKPITYEELEQTVRSKFNLMGKEIAIKVITPDNEENNINDEEDYNEKEYQNLKKYSVILDELEGENQEIQHMELENLDEIFNIEKELKINENEFQKFLEKELINETNENFLIKEKSEKYDINENQNILLENLKNEISSICDNSKREFLDSIKDYFAPIENFIIKTKNELILDENEYIGINEMDNFTNYDPYLNKDNNINEDEPIIKLSIDSDKKDYEIFEDEVNNIKIKDIIIKNLSNSKITNKNFHWVKDEDSDKEIDIPKDKNEIKIKDYEIEEEKKSELNLIIHNHKINKDYFLKFYICNEINENVTKKPFFVNVKIIKKRKDDKIVEPKEPIVVKPEEPIVDKSVKKIIAKPEEPIVNNPKELIINQPEERKVPNPENEMSQEEVNLIYDEFEESNYISGYIDRDVMESKIREFKGDREKIREFIEKEM